MKKFGCLLGLAVLLLMLCACGQQPAKTADLNAVMADLEKTYGLDDMMTLTADDMLELYGIQEADVKQFAARLPMESLRADEVVLIEATDAQAAERVKEQLEARYQAKLNETRNYLVDEYEKISACKVTANGNYVTLIVSKDAEAMTADYEKAFR